MDGGRPGTRSPRELGFARWLGSPPVFCSRNRALEQGQGHYGKGAQDANRQANQQAIHSNRQLFLLIAILRHKKNVRLHFLRTPSTINTWNNRLHSTLMAAGHRGEWHLWAELLARSGRTELSRTRFTKPAHQNIDILIHVGPVPRLFALIRARCSVSCNLA
jgi:hypothetical protein